MEKENAAAVAAAAADGRCPGEAKALPATGAAAGLLAPGAAAGAADPAASAAAPPSVEGDEETARSPSQAVFSAVDAYAEAGLRNIRIAGSRALVFPQLLLEEIPVSARAEETVLRGRCDVANILKGEDDRLLVVVGPCSIHDFDAAVQYASLLHSVQPRFAATLRLVMRVYFEKPRTTVGWKGLINDPDLDNSFQINKGLRIARLLLSRITDMGVAVGCEFLDTMIPQYTSDFVSWCAIGARTTECQLHRELVSGLSFPVGFKNGTSGNTNIAVDACISAGHPHAFMSITKHGSPAIFRSTGNPDAHVILRGGSATGPNFSREHINALVQVLREKQLKPYVAIDFSHGNSGKNHKNQIKVGEDVAQQIANGATAIAAVMIESNLKAGNQPAPQAPLERFDAKHRRPFSFEQDPGLLKTLIPGVSITDECLDWESTVTLLETLSNAVQIRRERRST